ncbi:pentatricopeptide repeat-containing protein 2, mitochondrial-like [Palaemon carinicauda]|uniref:pentatricopeptide repeat-containing protein 2, mitochondrial-like n=1 Tax=Palaemon carinicauda TaxID=392227 RepID=UPI0035B68204
MAYGGLIRLSNVLWSYSRQSGAGIALGLRHTKTVSPVQDSLQGYRHIFSAAALGVENYEENREKVLLQFQNIQDKFRQQMHEILQSETKAMIFTEDFKNAIHLAECKDEDMSLVVGMAKRFNSQHGGLRFGVYVFGPVVMRMFHYLNQPEYMLQALRSKELEGFFDQIISYQLAMDLLFKHGMYQEVIDVFEELQEKRLNGIKYPKNCLTLSLAACYKINTIESYHKMLEFFEGSQEYGTHLTARHISFSSALSLNQGFPHISLEILSKATNVRLLSIMNLKVLSLAELNRVEDVLPILRSLLRVDLPDTHPRGGSQMIFETTVKKVEQAVNETGNKELIAEYSHIAKGLQGNGFISVKTLDDFICAPIEQLPSKNPKFSIDRDRAMLAASFNQNSRSQRRRKSGGRPGLMDME